MTNLQTLISMCCL